MIKRNVLELDNLPLEGYFLSLYVLLGSSRTRREKASLTSTKFRVSMFNDKPPCMPLCFGIVDYTTEAVGAFSSLLASTAVVFPFFRLCSNEFFFFRSLFLAFLFPLVPFF